MNDVAEHGRALPLNGEPLFPGLPFLGVGEMDYYQGWSEHRTNIPPGNHELKCGGLIGTGSDRGLDFKALRQIFQQDLNLPRIFLNGGNGCRWKGECQETDYEMRSGTDEVQSQGTKGVRFGEKRTAILVNSAYGGDNGNRCLREKSQK